MSGASVLSCCSGSRLVVQSRATEPWAKQPCCMGIDEAGRGPVLGPMVYAAAYAPVSEDLKNKEFNDSKQLSEAKRETLFEAIGRDSSIGYAAEILSAQLISSAMLSRNKVSLNKVAEDSTFLIIQTVLDAGVNLTEVFVDTVGDADRYRQRLTQRFPFLKFEVCPKADALFPIVSAASIVAKVIRDRSLIQCQQELGLTGEMGSGYPGDPSTVAWLKANLHPVLGFPALVRFSWETCARMLSDQASCAVIGFEADCEHNDQQQQRLSFAPSACPSLLETSGSGRHMFFKTRRLQPLAEAF